MRASRRTAVAGLALLLVAPLPIASAITAAATPAAPSTLGLDDLGDAVDDNVDTGKGPVKHIVDELIPPEPEPDETAEVPSLPEPEPDPVPDPVPAPEPEVVAPKPPTTTVPEPAPAPAPAPVPKPVEDAVSGSGSDAGSKTGSGSAPDSRSKAASGSKGSSGSADSPRSGTGATSGTGSTPNGSGLGPTLLGEPMGVEFASAGPNSSLISYSGMSPLLPEANAGDPNIRSLLIAGGQRNEAIAPVGDDFAGSVTGLLVLGTLASLMLYGSAAYLKFGKRRPATGRHKA